ncbi:hypothetical protein B0H34DRAFT_801258 [Crassisporium funariophilum]|nr:hypothetical protein B0H34DRAFT_801258 [Crassisporium funariophilum]
MSRPARRRLNTTIWIGVLEGVYLIEIQQLPAGGAMRITQQVIPLFIDAPSPELLQERLQSLPYTSGPRPSTPFSVSYPSYDEQRRQHHPLLPSTLYPHTKPGAFPGSSLNSPAVAGVSPPYDLHDDVPCSSCWLKVGGAGYVEGWTIVECVGELVEGRDGLTPMPLLSSTLIQTGAPPLPLQHAANGQQLGLSHGTQHLTGTASAVAALSTPAPHPLLLMATTADDVHHVQRVPLNPLPFLLPFLVPYPAALRLSPGALAAREYEDCSEGTSAAKGFRDDGGMLCAAVGWIKEEGLDVGLHLPMLKQGIILPPRPHSNPPPDNGGDGVEGPHLRHLHLYLGADSASRFEVSSRPTSCSHSGARSVALE